MPEMKITRRIIDPITFVERVGIEFIPRIEDSVIDDQLAGSMSYAVPKSLPRAPPPPSSSSEVVRPPTPPKQRGKENPNQPRGVPSPAGHRKGKTNGLGSMLSPRSRANRKSLTLSQIGEHHEMSESSMSDLSALQPSLNRSEHKKEKKPVEKCLRFSDEVELNEISRLRNSVIAEIFWASDEIANFRYEAFMEEAGLDIEEFG